MRWRLPLDNRTSPQIHRAVDPATRRTAAHRGPAFFVRLTFEEGLCSMVLPRMIVR
jgi:hypothetical protein